MSLRDTLKRALSQEQYDAVIDALGDDFNFDLVPRTRLNKVIKQRNKLQQQLLDGDTQGNPAGSDDDDDEPADQNTLDLILKALGDANNNGGNSKSKSNKDNNKDPMTLLKEQHQNEIEQLKIQYAVADQLRNAKAVDPDLIWSSNLLDKSKLKLDQNGKLTGFEEQLKTLQKDKAFLFTEVPPAGNEDGSQGSGGTQGGQSGNPNVPTGTGRSGASAGGTTPSVLDSKLDGIFNQFGINMNSNNEE